ncbi:murein biosynthesis integral membrane protein MurJ [Salisaeta longa]|uniref:murein biosynthesis integral membrane protein MurJ n=1 Tax=Salisaeta longa TaxID=503170 RepID=UPI0003B5DBB5|nr:murein biosynthesis integral membrane protein MurJ [Salisaeta longa]
MDETDASPPNEPSAASSDSRAGSVAAGILSSRVAGLLRESAFAYYFGVSAFTDVLQVAFKSPNLIQNLLGEGTISAAFIPVYTRLLEEESPEAAGRFAGAIFGLLLAIVGVLVIVGVVAARPLAIVLAPGYVGDAAQVAAGARAINRLDLLVDAVRIIFPMAGLATLAAWALGILNSHRQFFIPYVAPALWNVSIIAALAAGALYWTGTPWTPAALASDQLARLVLAACGGALVGGALQFGVQLPFVARHLTGFRLSLSTQVHGVRDALRAFGPVVAGRGVVQLSSYLDTFLATFLAVGALSALRFAQLFYLLPISLFGLAVAASELPELSRLTAAARQTFAERVRRSLRQIAFLTVPTVVGYLSFGYLLVAALLQRGQFGVASTWLVWLVLGAYALGILASTFARLLQNAFYAVEETKTPARVAAWRVGVSTAVALPAMFLLDRVALTAVVGHPLAGEPLFLGAVGLGLGASAGAWMELWWLRRALHARLPALVLPWRAIGRMGLLATIVGALCTGLWWMLPAWPPLVLAGLVGGSFAGCYLAGAAALGFPEGRAWTHQLRRRLPW